MSRRPWFPFYAGDYLADTGHLTLDQHGAYLLLILHYYRTTNLPADSVYRICRCANDADKKICDSIVREFFVREGDLYKQKRIEEELATLDHKSMQYAARAQKAANARWNPNPAPDAETIAEPVASMPAQPTLERVAELSAETPRARKKKQVSLIDPRHVPVREFILHQHGRTFPAAPRCPWDGHTGTVLKKLLKANPSWKVEQIQEMVKNRFASEGIPPDAPAEWLPRLSTYAAGPLNKYGHLLSEKTNGKRVVGDALATHRALLGVQ